MPLRSDIKKVLVIGSGPIVIGQAAEFDYAGTQACRALKAEGLEVVLINSNPATIMTDKHMADKIYIEPLTLDVVKKIIKIEKPDSILVNARRSDGSYPFNAACGGRLPCRERCKAARCKSRNYPQGRGQTGVQGYYGGYRRAVYSLKGS